MSKVNDVVSWIMGGEDKVLKLQKLDKTYDIADNVFSVMEKNKILEKENFSVEVEIDETKGQNGTITSLKEAKGATKTEPSKEAPPTGTNPVGKDNILKELTVHGVSVDKKGVIFKEEDKVWYTLDDSIDAQVFKDSCTGRTIEAYIEETDQGNDIIKSFTEKAEEVKEPSESSDKQQKKTYNNGNKSIEAQAGMKAAYTIVANMVTKDSEKEVVLKLITDIAEHSYETIQKLKNKE